MLSGTNMTPLSGRISAFYKSNADFLHQAALKIVSGREVRKPKDNIGDFFRSDGIKRENSVYEMYKREISDTLSMLDVAAKAGEMNYNDLERMQKLVEWYQDPSGDIVQQTGAKAEFDMKIQIITDRIANTKWNDQQLVVNSGATPLRSIAIDAGDPSQTYDISFGAQDVTDPSGLDITNGTVAADLEAELDKATSYMAKVSAYQRGLKAQLNLIDTKISNNLAYDSKIGSLDEAQAMQKYNIQLTQQRYAASMLTQMVSNQMRLVNLLG